MRLREREGLEHEVHAVTEQAAKAGFTLSVYGHLFDEHLDELASALDGTSGGTSAVQPIAALAEKGL